MPIDKTINQPDGADIQGPKPPTNPVEFSRWLQRPRVNPKNPKVRPDDSALLPEPPDWQSFLAPSPPIDYLPVTH